MAKDSKLAAISRLHGQRACAIFGKYLIQNGKVQPLKCNKFAFGYRLQTSVPFTIELALVIIC